MYISHFEAVAALIPQAIQGVKQAERAARPENRKPRDRLREVAAAGDSAHLPARWFNIGRGARDFGDRVTLVAASNAPQP